MKLHCLGTAGYHPNEQRQTSCYFIPERSLLLDAGSGLFRIRDLICTSELDVLLSHAHLDHVVGLTFLLDVVATTPLRKIRVHGDEKKLEAIRQHLFAPLIFPILPPIEWHPFQSEHGKRIINDAVVHWFPLEHPGDSLGYCIDFSETQLAFVTDTHARDHSNYWSEIRDVPWLLHECNWLDDQLEFAERIGHSTPTRAILGARNAGISKLLLTHFDPIQEGAIREQILQVSQSVPHMHVHCVEDGEAISLVSDIARPAIRSVSEGQA